MLIVDTHQIDDLARRLKYEAPKALAYAAKNILNRAAFEARKQWQREMESTFTLRNKWTKGSIRVEKVQGLNVRSMQSRVGSLADYMQIQEESGTIRGGPQGYRYPSKFVKPAGKVTKHRFRMKRLKLNHPKLEQFASTRQKIAVASRMAYASGHKFLFLDISPSSKGMYQLMGAKRRPKMRLLWDMRRGSVEIPRHATLEPTVAKVKRRMPRYAAAELLKQLKRARLA